MFQRSARDPGGWAFGRIATIRSVRDASRIGCGRTRTCTTAKSLRCSAIELRTHSAGHTPAKLTCSCLQPLAGGGFEPPTSGLWAQRAASLLHPAIKFLPAPQRSRRARRATRPLRVFDRAVAPATRISDIARRADGTPSLMITVGAAAFRPTRSPVGAPAWIRVHLWFHSP